MTACCYFVQGKYVHKSTQKHQELSGFRPTPDPWGRGPTPGSFDLIRHTANWSVPTPPAGYISLIFLHFLTFLPKGVNHKGLGLWIAIVHYITHMCVHFSCRSEILVMGKSLFERNKIFLFALFILQEYDFLTLKYRFCYFNISCSHSVAKNLIWKGIETNVCENISWHIWHKKAKRWKSHKAINLHEHSKLNNLTFSQKNIFDSTFFSYWNLQLNVT